MKRLDFIRSMGVIGVGLLLPWRRKEMIENKVKQGDSIAWGRYFECPECGNNEGACSTLMYRNGTEITYHDEVCLKLYGGCGYDKNLMKSYRKKPTCLTR